ncbi:hypothetical protein [Salsipaludibacter albus]|uniref:hypothetical protein n=1 Tax=Salsipaludibacter albus TaxID=2849650 RepID=UPI001EE45973|nr:hypothetical protein [Salsipaludibacter albus]MBY5161194.1 hypothetical protein [Salsipaludibacter albus]
MPDANEDRGTDLDHDGVAVPTSGARAWAVAGAVGAVAAIWFVLPGVLGMVAGSVAHLKGDRWGMPVAVVSAVTTIAGMALVFWVRG